MSARHTGVDCFHCGEPVPSGVDLRFEIDGAEQPMCCNGCLAVASLIQNSGLGRYYDFRDAVPLKPVEEPALARFAAWDREAVLDFHSSLHSSAQHDGLRKIQLVLENVHCPACAWLVHRYLSSFPGVRESKLNVGDGRLRLTFDPAQTPLSQLAQALARLGYPPHLDSPTSDADRDRNERRRMLRYILVAALGMMQVMSYALSKYIGAFQGMDAEMEQFFRLISMLVAVPVALYAGQPFYRSAWQHIKQRSIGLDIPVAAAMLIALFSSVLITLFGQGEVYFDSVVMFIFFLLLGRFAVMLSRQQSGALHTALARALPGQARRMTDAGVEPVGLIELARGDRVMVADGEIVPADGVIVDGRGHVDEALLSGESVPRVRASGDRVMAGSLLTEGALTLEIDATGQSTVLASIVDLLSEARSTRPKLAQMADRAAGWFIALILVSTSIAAMVWLQIDPSRVIPVVLAMLVVACPCALALGTPTALASATRGLAEAGVLTANPDALARFAQITHVVLDKTGTLTRPVMRLAETRLAETHPADEANAGGLSEQRVIEIAAALERVSTHPIASAFAEHDQGLTVAEAQSHGSRGVSGWIEQREYFLGRPDWVASEVGLDIVLPERGIWIALASKTNHQNRMIATFRLDSPLRAGSQALIETLNNRGIEVIMASGDRVGNVEPLANDLGIQHYHSGMRPADKLALVKQLQDEDAVVAMVGDGINDAPVLAGADVSIALAEGAAIAQTQADMVVTGKGLNALGQIFVQAPRVRRIIRQNLGWSLAYNFSSLPLAAIGIIPPWAAAIGMSLSSLGVVLNARRLARTSAVTHGDEAKKPAGDYDNYNDHPTPKDRLARST
ncbi:MAG: heavy metal translocating P-type ATPase metal-binding domain-containing protein [Pseudomonadota bacterium]